MKAALYEQFKSIKKDKAERSTASPTQKEATSVIIQLRVLYHYFERHIFLFWGVAGCVKNKA